MALDNVGGRNYSDVMMNFLVAFVLVALVGGCVADDAEQSVAEFSAAPEKTLLIRLSLYNSAPELVDACAADLGLIRGHDNWHDAYPVYQVACDDGTAIYEVPSAPTNFWFLDELPKVIGPEFTLAPDEIIGQLRVSVRLPPPRN